MTLFTPKAEIQVSGVWTDITSLWYQRDVCTITRGRRSEGSTADASACAMTFNNRSGNLSLRNPLGAYYGQISRNTPLRISLPATSSYLWLTAVGQYASCPDSVPLDITGDLDFRVDLWCSSWRQNIDLGGKYNITGNQRSWRLLLNADGTLLFTRSTDGTTPIHIYSTLPIPYPISGRRAIRVTWQQNNGAGSNVTTFYTAPTSAGPWTQLGTTVVNSGTVATFASTATLRAGCLNVGWTTFGEERYYSMQVYQGIAGTLRASPDFTTRADGTTSFNDAQGNTWTLGTGAVITARDYRFAGEVPEWPTTWDPTGRDIYVPITAAGPMRRLGKGSRSVLSAYRRGCTSVIAPVTNLIGYWPCEDAAGSSTIASGLPSNPAGMVYGPLSWAADSSSFPCSDALPTWNVTSATFTVPSYTPTGQTQVRILLSIPAAGGVNGSVLFRVNTTGTAARWDVVYGTGGTLTLNAYDSSGTSILSNGPTAFSLNGVPLRLSLHLTESGGNITYTIASLPVGSSVGSFLTATLTGRTVSIVKQINIAPNSDVGSITIGQLLLQSAVTSIFDQSNLLNANAGETAGARIARLCAEENIACSVIGDSPSGTLMGNQRQETIMSLLRECETTDAGILYELRDRVGIGYRTTRSMYNQGVGLALDYLLADLSPPFVPVEDDQFISNDVTASKSSGSSARYVKTSGSLSTAAPPAGVNTYDSTVTVNPQLDGLLSGIASWLVHLGTVDEPRYPSMSIKLARPNFYSAGNAAKLAAVVALEIGDRVTVANPPASMPPETINQLMIGYTETLTAFERNITMVCRPASPYAIATYSDASSRFAAENAQLTANINSSVTSFQVTTVSGAPWTTAVASFPFDVMIGGERMTVSGITSATSPQTFTVTRHVNGITKAHTAGEAVQLFQPVYYGL